MEKRFTGFSFCPPVTKKGSATKQSCTITAGRRKLGLLAFTVPGMTGAAFSPLTGTWYFFPTHVVQMAPALLSRKQTTATGALATFKTVWTVWISSYRGELLILTTLG